MEPEKPAQKNFYELPENEKKQRYNEMKKREEESQQKDNTPVKENLLPSKENQKAKIELKGPLSDAIKEAAEEVLGKKLPEETPTQQPIVNPEKSPADLDIDAAKKYLEEVYGGEKSSLNVGIEDSEKLFNTEVVDKSIPIPIDQKVKKPELKSQKEEIEKPIEKIKIEPKLEAKTEEIGETKEKGNKNQKQEPSGEGVMEKMNKDMQEKQSVSEDHVDKLQGIREKIANEENVITEERESLKKPATKTLGDAKDNLATEAGETKIEAMETKIETAKSTVEEITEKIKREREEQEARVKAAKNELIDLAEKIKKEEEADLPMTLLKESLYKKAKEVFEVAKGESLEKTAGERAKAEAKNDGLKVVTPEEYRKVKIIETQDRIRQKERSAVIKERWDMMTDKEKARYFDSGKDKNDPVAIDSARVRFATKLNEKINTKRQELSKGKKGIAISEDVFYELMRKGLKSEDIKRRGFFGRIFYGGEITIPPLDKTDGRGSLISDKEYLTEEMESRVKENIADLAKEEVERKIIEGQKRWRSKKQRYRVELIQETAAEFQVELQPKIEYHPKTEPLEELSPETTEKPKPLKKARKKIESGIKTKKKKPKTNKSKKVVKNKIAEIS